ncbi:DsrE family protein [Celeribacter sp. PS-C1]|uniref:DsrE family protein n=1 Tax=Celeribacter sp. PS-C1 TaxID=2820813 RepID=UPI001CA4DF13|nr:DsrE family protein [Celeribacter sp. PS-C1]MBW6416081.1 DsrE family protein [Celeribacter sp. PS-C1]
MRRTLAFCLALLLSSGFAMAEGITHKIAIHIDESDMRLMNMALNNANNARNYFQSIGDEVVLEIVAYGPGLQMFLKGQSPVADRIETMALEYDDIQFSACGNTLRNMSKNLDRPLEILEEATVVESGVARLVLLQEDGYSYIRP